MPFDLQPALRGDLLELRPLRADDFDALFAAASDPLIWEQHSESDRYTAEKIRRYFDGAMQSGGAYNKEMKRLLLEHAFQFVDRVDFLVGPSNIRSQRAVEKIGGKLAGTRVSDGRESLLFELTAEVFRQWRAATGPVAPASARDRER
jgi:N-acetyltransferase